MGAGAPHGCEERADDAGVDVDEEHVDVHEVVGIAKGEDDLGEVEDDREHEVSDCDPEKGAEAVEIRVSWRNSARSDMFGAHSVMELAYSRWSLWSMRMRRGPFYLLQLCRDVVGTAQT